MKKSKVTAFAVKRGYALLLTLAMLISVSVMPSYAASYLDTNFDSASYTAISNSSNGDLFNLTEATALIASEKCTYDREGNPVTSTGTAKNTNVQHYEDAVFGKLSGDKSLAMRIDSGEGTSKAMQWYLRFQEGSTQTKTSLNDDRVYEFSIAKTGGITLNFYALDGIGSTSAIPLEDGKWNRVAISFPTVSSGGKAVIYVNGKEVYNKTVTSVLYRTRLLVNVPQGTTKAFFGIDDMRMLTGQASYNGTATALPVLSVADNAYMLKDNTVKIPAATVVTVEALKAALNTDAEVRIYDDAMAEELKGPAVSYTTQKSDTDTVAAGDIIVLADGAVMNTYSVGILSAEDKYFADYDFEEDDETLYVNSSSTSISTADGLYAKAADDTSFVMTTNSDTTTSSFANLPAFPSLEGSSFDPNGTYTAEFSVAAMDNEYSRIQIGLISKPTNDSGASTSVTRAALQINNDGSVAVLGQSGSFEAYSISAYEWVRVAVTIDNSTNTFNTYINGVPAALGVRINNNSSYPNWAGLSRFSIITYEATAGNGQYTSVAVDDLKIYKGGYEGTADAISMGSYSVSGNILYVNKNSVTAADIAAELGCSAAAYTDKTYSTAKLDYLADGDVVVVTKGLVKRYFTVSTEVIPTVDLNFDDRNQTVYYPSGRANAEYAEAKFGRAAGDYSYSLKSTTENSAYFNLQAGTHLAVGSNWKDDNYTAGSGTAEFSMAFDGRAKRCELLNLWAYKNIDAETHGTGYDARTTVVPISITSSGSVSITGAKDDFDIYRINPGEWLHVAMVIDGVNENYDLYLNGVLAAEDVSMAYGGLLEGTWKYIGIDALRPAVYPVSAEEYAALYLDDFKVYAGTPDNLTADAVDLGAYANTDSVLLSSGAPDADAIAAELSGYTVTAYEDCTYKETKTGALEVDDIAVVSKGLIYRYLTVSDTSLGLTLMINGTKVNNLTAGAVSASITPKGYAYAPALIVAFYENYGTENQTLVGISAAKDEDSDGVYITDELNLTEEELQNTAVKLMVWDGFNVMNPLKDVSVYLVK